MFRTAPVVILSVVLSIAISGCQPANPSASGGPAVKNSSEYILPRIDPKKEEGIVAPGTDVAVSVTVRNQTAGKVSMIWLEESSGSRIHYHDIAPGSEVSQDTWEGHFWLILDKDEKALGIYRTPDRNGVIVVK